MLLLLTALEVLQFIAGAEERQQDLRSRYTYRELQENWRLDPYGRIIPGSHKTKTYEVLLVSGQRHRKLIARDGQPLSAEEQFQVEEDLRRLRPSNDTRALPLRHLADSHQLILRDNALEAVQSGKTIQLIFDPADHTILEQVTETNTTRMRLVYRRLPDGATLPSRIETDFVVGDIRGRQISTFDHYTAN